MSFEQFYAFDSTTITLFSDVMKGAGRNPRGDGKKKGGLKVHMLTDVHADTGVFATISEAKMHDKKFLSRLNPTKGSMPVFDRAYSYYLQFAEWTEEGVNFVYRLKEKAGDEVQEVLFEKTLEKGEFGVYKIEHVHLKYKKEKQEKTLCLRPVYYRDEKGRKYKFITNNWEISAEEVALIYKYRWTTELTFKKLKQNFQLHFFYSETENGIKTQILCTLTAHLLLSVIRALSKSEKAFSTVAALVRIHLTSHPDLILVVTEGRRYYKKSEKRKNKSPAAVQMTLF
ncbi:MAG: IS4 family transposase [Bacteroidales bacterium]|nr:IS4 family transposase [Bacteroidales bacterium]